MKNLQIPLAFLLVILIWTATPLAVKWSSVGIPFTSVLLRMVIGALSGIAIMLLLSSKLPWDATARRLYLVSGLSMFAAMSLIYLAAQTIPSGWIAVIYGLSPLITGVISAFVEPDAKLTMQRIIGISLGMLGLILVFQFGLSADRSTLPGIATIFAAVLISAGSSVFIRQLCKDSELSPMQINVGSLVTAIPFFAITAGLLESGADLTLSQQQLVALLFLGIIGTGAGFTLYFFLLKKLPASKVALVTLITPITALLLGNLVNNEPVIAQVWIGATCVCLGLLLYEYKPRLGLRKL